MGPPQRPSPSLDKRKRRVEQIKGMGAAILILATFIVVALLVIGLLVG